MNLSMSERSHCTSCVLCHFKNPEKTHASEHRDTDRRNDLRLYQNYLHDTADRREAVETVEQRHEITLNTINHILNSTPKKIEAKSFKREDFLSG